MNRLKLLVGAAILTGALTVNAAAQDESVVLMNSVSTASQSAVLVAFLASIDAGDLARTGMSISNILGAPQGSGFPTGGNESGPLSIYLFNGIGTVYTFHTSDHPDVGTGVDVDGNLPPGGTYTVNLDEILAALFPDRVPADRDFAGYAWVVADFDAVAGTYFNAFPAAGASQAFQMVPTAGGLPIIPNGQ